MTGSLTSGLAGAAQAVVGNKSAYSTHSERKTDPPVLSSSHNDVRVNGNTISSQSHHAIISNKALSKNSSIHSATHVNAYNLSASASGIASKRPPSASHAILG